LWKATGQEDINLEIRKRIEDGGISKAASLWNPQGKRRT
jgi:hypothetical protein